MEKGNGSGIEKLFSPALCLELTAPPGGEFKRVFAVPRADFSRSEGQDFQEKGKALVPTDERARKINRFMVGVSLWFRASLVHWNQLESCGIT
jgi:hypothetical protein